MWSLRHLSLRRKLTAIAILSAGVALLLACAAFVTYELVTFRSTMVRNLGTQALIMGRQCTSALVFKDPESAAATLGALRAEPHVVSAALYTADGALFATYLRDSAPDRAEPPKLPEGPSEGHNFASQGLVLFRSIEFDNAPIGSVVIESDLEEMRERLRRYAGIVGAVLLAAIAVAYGTASRLQRVVTGPVLHLVETARAVSSHRDYSVRAVSQGQDELGLLVRSFNEMLDQIQERDVALQEARQDLERQVDERTRDLQREIGERKLLEEELREKNRALEEQSRRVQEATRLKSEFLANMSHELRTPLNAIIGFAELMHDGKIGPVSADHQECLDDILTSSRHLLQLINDVLDLSKVEAGKMEFRPETVAVAKIAREVTDILRSLSAKRHIRVTVDIDPQLVATVVVDPGKLKQVLYNYISNALKFTPNGGAVVLRARAEGEQHFRVEVEDNGIGIRPEDLPRLFREFQQLDSSTAKAYPGTGLGLALTKRIVEAQGGQVGVTSTPGEGSLFFAVLPNVTFPSEEVGPAPGLRVKGRPGAATILVVEDDSRERAWLVTTLAADGYAVEVAASGRQALDLCRERAFDAITLDLLLPDMGGWEVLKGLRESGPNQSTPAIVVTVVAEKGVVVGFAVHDYLLKPVRRERLLESLQRAGAIVPGPQPILVVDDDPQARRLMETTLQGLGLRSVGASGGEEGLQAAASDPPAAVILDLLMPEMDGFEFLDRFRKTASGPATPVIVWTAKDLSPEDYARLKATAQHVVTKSAVTTVVADLIARVKARGTLPTAAGPTQGVVRVKHFTILIVEDNPITRKMMRFALESEAYTVIEAADGRSALAMAAERLPDLVLQDYVLPDMDGLRLLEGLRALPGGGNLPVLMITGMVSQLDDLRARAGGPTSILPKPLEPSRLVDIVRTHLAAGADSPTPGNGKRVLVVDDEVLGRKLAALRLRDAGFEVETAAGGQEALAMAMASPPDAILSDVLMPGMDGFELCGFVRREPRLASTPVVLLSSAFADGEDRRLAVEIGASALLVRTPDMQDAIRALGAALREGGKRVAATVSAEEVAGLHAARVQVQLEKQVARNEALLRQGAIQSAALSVVRGLALALASPRDVPSILADVLVHCLDAAGLSTGLLYLASPDGRLKLQAQAGMPSEAREAAARAFGQPELLMEVLAQGEPVAYHLGAEGVDPRFRALGVGLARSSALVVPFLVGEERVGVLVLGADSQDLSEHVWLGFARALAAQFGQTIALGRFLARGVASEARYRSLMEQANDAILLMDENGIVEVNRQAEVLLGRPRAALIGRAYADLVVPEEREDALAAGAVLRAEGTARSSARHFARADGSSVSVDVSGSLVRVGEESLFVLIVRDMTEREEAGRKLQESEEQYRLLFETNPHPMSIYHPDTRAFLAVNEAAVRLYGYTRDEFLAMTLQGLRPEVVGQPALLDDFAGGIWRHRRKDGSAVVVEVASSATLFQGHPARLVLATDISAKRQLEEQLLQSQKMEAVGRLAGGVAHDFNNLLSVITGYSELLRGSLDPEHPGQQRVEQIRKAADRAAALTRQLLTFSRKEVMQPTVLDLNEVVADIEKMLQRLIGEDVQLVMRLGPDLGRVRADRGQMDQVMLNLVVNARDAMPRGGKVTLETANQILDRPAARLYGDVEPGNYVMLAVSDSGHGMDAETMSHIFEPFFTTKEEGKGTGLGLATVFGIVRQSGGHVSVYSELGVGTTFKVLLPRVPGEPTPRSAIASGARPSGGLETVLLVEDAEALRVMIREILEAAGYTILEASDPHEGLAKAGAHPGPVHLVLTDVIMPRMSGPDLVEKVRLPRPEIRVLFMSGYTNEAIGQRGVLQAGVQFLQKPFTSEGLLRAVRDALDQGRRG